MNTDTLEFVEPEERELEKQLYQEFIQTEDPVYKSIKVARFVSKSKGWRNGKRRIRKHLKEVYLIKYSVTKNSRFHLWKNFPFGVYAPEILKGESGEYPHETLKERIQELWGR